MQSADIKIRISKLSKSFEGKSVLRGLDLEVPTGKSTVLIGGAASGKSVFLRRSLS